MNGDTVQKHVIPKFPFDAVVGGSFMVTSTGW
jgi:hypothetical protein